MKYAGLVVGALLLLASGAGAEAAWYCEPLHAYYPMVGSCPVPWRPVDPQYGGQPFANPPTQHEAGDAAQQQMPQSQTDRSETPQTGAAASDQPTFPAPASFMRGDVLDQWCKGSTTASLAAVCGDDELRELAVQRLYAFEEAKARLNADQQKTLIADQNGWAMSYPQACGVRADVKPSFPLAASLKDCLAKAGRERLQYLKDYGQAKTETAAANPTPAPAPAPAATPPPSPAPATPATSTSAAGPAGSQSPAAATAPITPAPSQKDKAKPEQAKPNPPAQPASSNNASAAPQRHSPLSAVTNFARTIAMLIAIFVVAIWVFAAWMRSRRIARTGETQDRRL